MAQTIVRAVGLSKTFRDFWNRPKARAVNDIDFEVKEGEVLGLLGPNGSGKSTTVKMILGLLYPTAGNLSVFGKSPRDVNTKKEIGYLPEESYLYKYLTAEETLEFFGALFKLSKAECRRRSEQLLEMVGLSHARRRQVGEFSKGMARRIGLAQAMINDPSLLILDEPTSGLDPLGCREVKDLILTMKKRGKTVIVTSHLLSDVEDICDRVIILYGGRIRAQGSLNELLTVTEASRITTPLLSPEVSTKVIDILRNNLNGEEFKIDHPRMTLEEFFLDVINRAKADSVETAGVSGGGHIADYLTDDRETLISSLLVEKSVPRDRESEEEITKEAREIAEEKSEVLKELSEKKVAAPEKSAESETKSKSQSMADADRKLQDLLGGK